MYTVIDIQAWEFIHNIFVVFLYVIKLNISTSKTVNEIVLSKKFYCNFTKIEIGSFKITIIIILKFNYGKFRNINFFLRR